MKWAPAAQALFVAAAAVSVYSYVTAAKEGEARRICTPVCALRPDYAGSNRLAPDFELPTLDGKMVRLSDYRGKVVIINFWTKTCAPCLKEMPDVADLAKLVADHPHIELITISTDESADDARDTLRSVLNQEAPFITLVDPDAEMVSAKYGTTLYPETWFIDPQGVIRARFDGPRAWTDALVFDFAESLLHRLQCDVEFLARKPTAGLTALCEDIPGLQ